MVMQPRRAAYWILYLLNHLKSSSAWEQYHSPSRAPAIRQPNKTSSDVATNTEGHPTNNGHVSEQVTMRNNTNGRVIYPSRYFHNIRETTALQSPTRSTYESNDSSERIRKENFNETVIRRAPEGTKTTSNNFRDSVTTADQDGGRHDIHSVNNGNVARTEGPNSDISTTVISNSLVNHTRPQVLYTTAGESVTDMETTTSVAATDEDGGAARSQPSERVPGSTTPLEGQRTRVRNLTTQVPMPTQNVLTTTSVQSTATPVPALNETETTLDIQQSRTVISAQTELRPTTWRSLTSISTDHFSTGATGLSNETTMTTVGKTEHERTTTGTVGSAHQDATMAGENTRAPPEGTTARYTDDQKTSNSVHPSSPAATTSTEAKQMTDMNGMISTVEEQEWPRAKTDHSDDAFESTHKQNESERSTTTQAERTTANGERSTTPSTSLKTTEQDKLASVTTREKIHVNDTGTFSTTQKKQYGLSTNTVRVRLGFDADYGDRVQGRQWQFAAHMRQQLSGLLRVPLDGIQNVTVTPGSIRLAFDLVPVKTATLELGRPDLEAARADLMTRINRGTVTLTDLDGNRLPIFTTYSSRGDTILIVASIISATFIASVLLLLVILFVQKRMNRTSKVTPTHQLYNRHLEQSDSFSGLVPGRGLLSRHLNQSVGKEILSHFTSRQDSAVPGPPEYKLPGKSAASDDETSQDEYTQSDSSVYPDTSDCTPSTFTHWTTANSAHLEDTHLRLDRP